MSWRYIAVYTVVKWVLLWSGKLRHRSTCDIIETSNFITARFCSNASDACHESQDCRIRIKTLRRKPSGPLDEAAR